MYLINKTDILKSTEAIVTSATTAETVSYSILKTPHNEAQEFAYNTHWRVGANGEAGHTEKSVNFTAIKTKVAVSKINVLAASIDVTPGKNSAETINAISQAGYSIAINF